MAARNTTFIMKTVRVGLNAPQHDAAVNKRLDEWVSVQCLQMDKADASQIAERKRQKELKVRMSLVICFDRCWCSVGMHACPSPPR